MEVILFKTGQLVITKYCKNFINACYQGLIKCYLITINKRLVILMD